MEIEDTLGQQVEAEMWDRRWATIYEVYPDAPLTETYQEEVAARLAATIACLHPIFVDLRSAVAERFRYFREVRPSAPDPLVSSIGITGVLA